LFTINTKAGTAGSATISFNTVDIIGEGNSLGSASSNGNYTINALTVTPVVTAPAATPKKAVVPTAVKTTPKAEVAPVKIEPAKETSTAKEGKANNEVLQLAATAQAVPQDNGRIIGWGISGIIGFILGYAACALKNKKAKV
jgi:hypothetical protein